MVIFYVFFAILTASLPGLFWLLFFLKEDCHPEPKRLIIYAFCIGGLVSIPVLGAQILFQHFAVNVLGNIIALIFGLALIEEIFKFLAAYWAVGNDPSFDEPIDSMIYMVVAAMGFATIENLFIAGDKLGFLGSTAVLDTIGTLSLRFVGATLLHVLSSGLLGYYWAKGRINKNVKGFVWFGIFLATVVHGVFNYLILRFQQDYLIFPSIFLIIAAFFVLNDFEKLKTEEKIEKGV